jgi:hypothetical protein
MIVLMNPPYKRVSNKDFTEGSSTSGLTETKVCQLMSDMGNSVEQLYSQFLYRFIKEGDFKICIFSPALFMSGSSFEKFRLKFLNKMSLKDGFLMNASEFDGTSDWGLSFTIWDNFESTDRNKFELKIKSSDDFGNINYLFDKIIYNLDGLERSSDWVRKEIKNIKSIDYPQMTTGLNVSNKKNVRSGKMIKDSIGYFSCGANNIEKNTSSVSLFTSAYSNGIGLSVLELNFLKCVSFFASRKSIKSTWINGKDEYIVPNESHPLWQKFQYDSIVYSLFNTSSNQSSLRQIKYKEKLWDIKNEFFWMSKEQMMELSEKKYFDDIYRDARSSDERYVYTLLHKEGLYEKLSPDAKLVLDTATELVKKTFDMREILHTEHPEYHLNTWDAGWYQIKLILKAFYPEDLKDFTKKYKEFEDRMRPLVYELGFLRK